MRGGRGDVTEKYRILGAVVGTGKELLSFSFSSLGLQAYGSMREIFTFRDVHEAEKKAEKRMFMEDERKNPSHGAHHASAR